MNNKEKNTNTFIFIFLIFMIICSLIFLTYNILKKDYNGLLKNTISVHRKNKTNTIYTINALNKLIMDENEGVLDKHFVINWELYKDTLILTNDEFIKLTPLKFEQLFNI